MNARIHRTRVVVPGLLTLLVGCSVSPPTTQPTERDAVSVVQRFLRADMGGAPDSAWALLRGCDVLPTADYIVPAVEARILGTDFQGDTARVTVRYLVLGKATSGSNRGVRWQFTPDVRADTIAFLVVPDSSGERWIECGYHPPVHSDVSTLANAVASMDDSARAQWSAALVAAQRIR